MSYSFTLYNNTSASNTINKSITAVADYNLDFKEKNNNLQNLNITLRISQPLNVNINYARILYSGKTLYYFVEILPDSKAKEQFILHLTLDVLMTYRNEILNLNCIIKRNTNKYNLYVPDDRLQTLKKTQIQTKAFNHTFVPYTSTVITLVGSSYD